MQDEVDLGILHETLLHLMTEHPPIVMKITVEFDSTTFYDSETGESPTEWSPNASSGDPEESQPQESPKYEASENTEEAQPQEPPKSVEEN